MTNRKDDILNTIFFTKKIDFWNIIKIFNIKKDGTWIMIFQFIKEGYNGFGGGVIINANHEHQNNIGWGKYGKRILWGDESIEG
jgi:hypothetical protein